MKFDKCADTASYVEAASCLICSAHEQGLPPISDDELAAAEAAGTVCDQCAEVVAENREAVR